MISPYLRIYAAHRTLSMTIERSISWYHRPIGEASGVCPHQGVPVSSKSSAQTFNRIGSLGLFHLSMIMRMYASRLKEPLAVELSPSGLVVLSFPLAWS